MPPSSPKLARPPARPSAKQAMSRIEEQVTDLKANYTLNAKDEAAIELLKDVGKFLAGELGVQALFKRFVG